MSCSTCGYSGPDYHDDPIDCVDHLRATIEAKDAEIADLKHDTDELIRKWRMVNIRADAAEARVKELEEEYSGNCVHCGSLVAPDDRNHWERCDKHPANDHIAVLGRDLTAMTSRYSRAATDIASLEQELAAITHVATTADPAGWWIAPRGSSDPSEWICVEEIKEQS